VVGKTDYLAGRDYRCGEDGMTNMITPLKKWRVGEICIGIALSPIIIFFIFLGVCFVIWNEYFVLEEPMWEVIKGMSWDKLTKAMQ